MFVYEEYPHWYQKGDTDMGRKGSKRRGYSYASTNGTGSPRGGYGSFSYFKPFRPNYTYTPPSYTPEAMDALQANIAKKVAEQQNINLANPGKQGNAGRSGSYYVNPSWSPDGKDSQLHIHQHNDGSGTTYSNYEGGKPTHRTTEWNK